MNKHIAYIDSKIENVKFFASGNFLVFSVVVVIARFYEGGAFGFWVFACLAIFLSLLASVTYALYLNELFLRKTHVLRAAAFPQSPLIGWMPRKFDTTNSNFVERVFRSLWAFNHDHPHQIRNIDEFNEFEGEMQSRCIRYQTLGAICFFASVLIFLLSEASGSLRENRDAEMISADTRVQAEEASPKQGVEE
jgi:lysylphosphatidylglycerol synthetase-like protein (DUF2156 family)